jgi:hypothetical protein
VHASQFAPFHPAGHAPLPCAQEQVPGAPAGEPLNRLDNGVGPVPIAGRLMVGAEAGPDTPNTGGGSATTGK